MNPLKELQKHHQSVWLDYIRRQLITSGELRRLVEEDGLRGITSNPSIFEKAIAGSTDYDETLGASLSADPRPEIEMLYEQLAIEDIRMAADILRPVYEDTDGADGFVSLEVSPHLAHDTEKTVADARRLWRAVDRPNVMIKVPATPEGMPALETLIAEGINVNATLIFSLDHYEAVAHAYLRGLERCPQPHRVASVASFFVSRVDAAVDRALEAIGTEEARRLQGKIAIANAKLAYERFREIFYGSTFDALRRRGARVQRPLWASTSTKNPNASDVLYVEELIGPDTVTTLPPTTLYAFRDHGRVRPSLQEGLEQARAALARLNELGIDLKAITEQLQTEGVRAFAASFDKLLVVLEEKRQAILKNQVDRQSLSLGRYRDRVDERVRTWQAARFARRLWQKDHTLWSPEPLPELRDRLGWLTLPETMPEQLDDVLAFGEAVKAEGIRHVVLLGMGGSSLAPEVFQRTFGHAPGFPGLIVLDSTHPAAVRAVEVQLDLARTLFLVSSKSGTTVETLSLFRYFWHRLSQRTSAPGRQFIAITDPETPLAALARERRFRRLFTAPPDVGGRYSALTAFGLVPAALIGVDVTGVLDRAWTMAEACAFCVAESNNPCLVLGAALGELALAGRDKVTFLASSSLMAFPAWLEQLIAESTGKEGKGIVPIIDEPPLPPEAYGADRFFISVALEGDEDDWERRGAALEAAGHPVARIRLTEKTDLGQEFFRWEVAVAAAGSVLGIHPFNQPDVELAKRLAREAMTPRGEAGREANAIHEVTAGERETLRRAMSDWLSAARPGDYVAIQAYLAPTPATTHHLQTVRKRLCDRLLLATTLGYGPRFLHSTGQLHKGGPNTGLFLQLVDEPTDDLPVPETTYSFGTLIRAQAVGDYRALIERKRRVLRVNLGRDVIEGLNALAEVLA